jgi:hypothetical protein
MSSLAGQLVRTVIVNWGLLSLVLGVLVAGSLAFAFVAVPPGTIPYP